MGRAKSPRARPASDANTIGNDPLHQSFARVSRQCPTGSDAVRKQSLPHKKAELPGEVIQLIGRRSFCRQCGAGMSGGGRRGKKTKQWTPQRVFRGACYLCSAQSMEGIMAFVTGDVVPSDDQEWPFKVVFTQNGEVISEWLVQSKEEGERQIIESLQGLAAEAEEEEDA
jgi:hypothetical protein